MSAVSMPSPADAISFAIAEVARFQQKVETGLLKTLLEHPDDWLWMLPHPDGRGSLIMGQKAGLPLFKACSQSLSASKYAGRIDVDALFNTYTQEMVRRFVTEGREINDAEADAVFQAALSNSVSRIEDLIHLIPCHLVLAANPDRVTMGTVTFWRREARWPAVADALDALDEGSIEPKYLSRPKIEEYYSAFSWIAEARVQQCELKPSRALAERMVWSALDCLQLLIGGHGLERMTIGGIATADDRRSHLVLKNGAVFNAEISIRGRDIPFDEESWSKMDSRDNQDLTELMGHAISAAYHLPEPAHLAERFIDSVHWFGLAMRDTSAASKIVMFLMAVERVLVPVYSRPIRSVVRRRSRPFCYWDKHNARVDRIYDIRGALAHGQLPSGSPDVIEAAEDAGEFAEQVLLGVLIVFGRHNFWRIDITADDLAATLDRHHAGYVARQKELAEAAKASEPTEANTISASRGSR